MSARFPIHIHRREEDGVTTFLATTSLTQLVISPERLDARLREVAAMYTRALADARAALDRARGDTSERARAYWRVAEAIRAFEASLDTVGFYLVGQTATFARDLGIHPGSLRKVLAFQRRHPDADALDAHARWTLYRERGRK